MTPVIDPADLAACRAMLATGSRTFNAAGKLLPHKVGAAAIALYAFCRVADDDVDDCAATEKSDALTALRVRLDRVYAGRPFPLAPDRAMAAIVAAHGLPRALPEALLEGFAWDAEARRYQTLSDLLGYAARVAGSVGAMMTVLMGVRDEQTLARATELGCAMQLSNIARDVGDDLRAGRLYLPLDWLAEADLDAGTLLANPTHSPALATVVRRLLTEAAALYARATPGIARLPLACRPAIFAARHLYAAIGDQVLRSGGDAITTRAVVSPRRKLAVLAHAVLPPLPLAGEGRGEGWQPHQTLPELHFLVQAAMTPGPTPAPSPTQARGVTEQVLFVATLFDRLAREGSR